MIGLLAGIAAVIIKNTVWLTSTGIEMLVSIGSGNYIYFALPLIGIALVLLFIKYFVHRPIEPGIPNVLYSISKKRGYLDRHNLFSSVIASSLTVGFGGSAGLEAPTMSTGSAWASVISKAFRMSYKHTILLLACACAGTMASIFKAPIAAIVFAVEVIMIDLTVFSLIPLLLSSATAVLTSYFFLGQEALYHFETKQYFVLGDLPFYILLGIVAGFVSVYFSKIQLYATSYFNKINSPTKRLLIGGVGMGILLFFFPSLYGEGYDAINKTLEGNLNYLFDYSLFYNFKDEIWAMILILTLVIFFKIVATSLTVGAGGVGGIFAPTLFVGVNTGMLFAQLVNLTGIRIINSSNFALIGMAGLITGVLHAPLTGIFLIADISGGYQLFVPLMITSAFAYIVVRSFSSNSIYHQQLANNKELLTHNQDANVLQMLEINKLLEHDFEQLCPEATLRDLTVAISKNHRNIFPVVDANGVFVGMINMNDVRHIIFNQEKYDEIKIKDIMYMPTHIVYFSDDMETVANTFQNSKEYNLVVLDNDNKYLGFLSRARVFSYYRKFIVDFSHEK